MGCLCGKYLEPKKIKDQWYPDYVSTLPRMDGKVVAITGSTTGTGLALARTCRWLGATVVLLNRDSDRVTIAKRSVQQAAVDSDDPTSPTSAKGPPSQQSLLEGQLNPGAALPEDPKTVSIACDLGNFASVRAAITELNEKFGDSGIDVLVNNAGVMALKDNATVDGFDIQMQVNHLSHFLLTQGVFSLLEKAAAKKGEARIVNHSSIARTQVKSTGLVAKYLEKNGGALGGNGMGGVWTRYGQTKLANVAFTHALHDRLSQKGSKVKALVAHPGVAATHLQVTTVKDGGMPSFAASAMVSQSSNDGALGIIRCTCAADVKSCEFYGPTNEGMKGPAVLLPKDNFVGSEQTKMLWEKSESACSISFLSSNLN